jgi:hypothetical protein
MGKPSLTLSAKAAGEPASTPMFGAMKGTFTIHGDIVGPVDRDWEAEWERKWDARGFVAPGKDGA